MAAQKCGAVFFFYFLLYFSLDFQVDAACQRLIVTGNSFFPVNAFYDLQPEFFQSNVYYKQTDPAGPYYLYNYGGSWWEFGYPPGGYSLWSCYNSNDAAAEFPYETDGGLYYNQNGYGFDSTFEIECLVEDDEFLYRPGMCLEDVLTELVVATMAVTQEECQDICRSDSRCKGYSYNVDGCSPHSANCDDTDLSVPFGMNAVRGLLSTATVGLPTWQSSDFDKWNGVSSLAVDGMVSSDYMSTFTCSHTMEEVQPWWLVKLPDVALITAVGIINRRDCCADRLQNFAVKVDTTDDINAVVAQFTAKNFVGQECAHVLTPLSAGERRYVACPEGIMGIYVGIHMVDPVIPTALTMCEVEVISVPVGRYAVYDNVPYEHSTVDNYCTDFFHGSLAQINDEAELDVIVDTQLPFRERTFAWIGNTPGDGGYSNEASWANEGVLQNIGNVRTDATCSASSESSGSYVCENLMDGSYGTSWRTLSESVSAWVKINFRYTYKVHIVRLLQLYAASEQVQGVNLEFSDGSSQAVTLSQKMSDTDPAVHDSFLTNGVTSKFLKLTITSVYTASNTGFTVVDVWGTELAGYEILDGLCIDGSDLGLTYTDLVDCQAQCKNLAGCTAFSYVLDGTYRQECTFFAGPCADPDIAIAGDATVTFRDTTDFGVTMRYIQCPSTYLAYSYATLGVAYQEHKIVDYIVAFDYCWEPDGPCWLNSYGMYASCTTGGVSSNMIFFDIVTSEVKQPEGDGHLGCYRDAPKRDLPSVSYMNSGSSTEECRGICTAAGKPYGGIEVGYECWCGDSYGEHGISMQCVERCSSGETCGGPWSHNVYRSDAGPVLPSDCYFLSNQVFVPQQEFILDQYIFVRGRCEGQEAYAVCERDHLFCLSEPCLNGGTCTDIPNDYECACVIGYTGNVCETDIDDCAAVPCQNGGTCEDGLNFFTCTCLLGYTGDVCQTDINECASGPCLNQGTCSEPALTLVACSCVAGFTGDWCETNIDECSSFPCQHGGTCTDSINSYTCSCRNGYSGSHCETEIDECASSPCVNGGTCEDQLAMYVCLCDAGYAGTHCETELDECASSPCLNGGACVDMVNMYECNCPSGFTGTHCETNINECGSDPCMNHVACHDLVNGYQCECLTGFTGVHCEIYGGIAGSWGDWQAWGECSVSCGIGNRIRERQCIPDTPGQDVANCGNYFFSQTDNCDMGTCQPVDGGWGDWEPISNCSSSCGPGIYFVRRYCVNPLPSYGGQPCQGESEDQRLCEIEPCPGHSRCDVWSTWSNCSGQCAAATHYRTRTCLPTHGQGQNVTEAYTRSCDLPDCDVQESMCDSCENTFNPASQSGLNCAGAPAACESGNAFCMTSYGANSEDELTLEKKCASEFECIGTLSSTEQQECNRLLSMSSILSLHVLGADEAADPAFDPSIFMDEDILLLWRLLNGTCSVCCQGTMCNGGVLPAIDSVFIMPSSASGLPAPMEMFLMCCLGVVPWMFT